MSDYVYLKPGGAVTAGLPDLPVPVRSERLSRVMHDGRVETDALLDELDFFLNQHPDYRHTYAELAARLAYLAGRQLADIGLWEAAARSLETGSRWNSENWSVRANHAVTLHLTEDFRGALAEYCKAIADPEVAASPLVTVLAARCCHELGEWEFGAGLLRSLVPLAPREPVFWDFLAEMEAKAVEHRRTSDNARPRETVGNQTAQPMQSKCPFCTQCGFQSHKGDLYCRRCGSLLHGQSENRGTG